MIILDESTEETKAIIEGWREEAKDMTVAMLPWFIKKLMNDYQHDYGTICHALSIGSVATMWAMNKEEQGGITGFQAGAIRWENLQNWETDLRGKPLTLVNYANMLYPQYDRKFQKTITPDTWAYLRLEARKNLQESPDAHEDVVAHWESIASGNGVVPFGYKIRED